MTRLARPRPSVPEGCYNEVMFRLCLARKTLIARDVALEWQRTHMRL
jgi:hypothetical protein